MVTRKQLLAQLKELTDLIKSEQFEKFRKDSEELHEIQDLISHVRFKLKDIRLIVNEETTERTIQVTYELPRINLTISEDGQVSKDDFFYATNYLELISLEDMQKIQNFIENLKK